MYFAVLPSTGPTTMTTLTGEAAVACVGEAMNPPNARARVRNESKRRWIARLDALWAPLLTVDMLFLSAGTQRENATNGVVCREGGDVAPAVRRATWGSSRLCRRGGLVPSLTMGPAAVAQWGGAPAHHRRDLWTRSSRGRTKGCAHAPREKYRSQTNCHLEDGHID